MMLWLALCTLTLAATAFLVLPFIRPQAVRRDSGHEAAALKDQVRAIEQDAAEPDADPAIEDLRKAEAARRLLAATEAPADGTGAARPPAPDRWTAIAVAAIVALGGAVLYASIGKPGVADAPATAAGAAALPGTDRSLPDVDTMIERLAQRLKSNPADADGWRMLGWSQFSTQNYAAAADAYRRAVALDGANTEYQSALAEALTMANGGAVPDEARSLLQRVRAANAADERAAFYWGLAESQRGNRAQALDLWLRTLARADVNSPWSAQLREHALSLARELHVDISARLPRAAPAPEFVPGADAGGPNPGSPMTGGDGSDQQQAIQGMVARLDARLAANPDDEEGWRRLMQSRMVLGQPDLAQQALDRGLTAFRGDAAAQRRLREAASQLGVPPTTR